LGSSQRSPDPPAGKGGGEMRGWERYGRGRRREGGEGKGGCQFLNLSLASGYALVYETTYIGK